MRGRPVILGDFGGGVDLHRDTSDMPPGTSPDMLNMVPLGDKPTSVRSRDGDTVVVNLANGFSVVMMQWLQKMGLLAVGQSDGKIRMVTTAGATSATVDFALANNNMACAVGPVSGGQGPFYAAGLGAGLATSFRYWDGVSGGTIVTPWTASAGTLPAGMFMLYANNRMWSAGLPSNYPGMSDPQSGVVFSEIGDPRNWPTANQTMFDPGDGELLTGFVYYDQYIFVFKRSKVWVIYDLDTSANRQLHRDVGAASSTNRSGMAAAACPGYGVAFYAGPDRGILLTDPSGRLSHISREVDPIFQATSNIALGPASSWTLAYQDDHLYVASVTVGLVAAFTSGVADILLDYDFRTKTWWRHRIANPGFGIGTAFLVPAVSGTSRLFSSNAVDRIHELFVPGAATDALGASLGSYWRTGFLPLSNPGARKRLRSLVARGSGPAVVSVFADQDPAAAVRSLLVTLDNEPILTALGVKDLWQVKVEMPGSTPFTLRQLDLFAGDRTR